MPEATARLKIASNVFTIMTLFLHVMQALAAMMLAKFLGVSKIVM
jgi:hypothetical protein